MKEISNNTNTTGTKPEKRRVISHGTPSLVEDERRTVQRGKYRTKRGRVFPVRQHTKQFFESLKETTVDKLIESGMTEVSRRRYGLPLSVKRDGHDIEVRYFTRNLHSDPKIFVYELQPTGLWRESFWILATPEQVYSPVSITAKGISVEKGTDDPRAAILSGMVNGFALGKRPDGELIAKYEGVESV